jgi:hypothetical protein
MGHSDYHYLFLNDSIEDAEGKSLKNDLSCGVICRREAARGLFDARDRVLNLLCECD